MWTILQIQSPFSSQELLDAPEQSWPEEVNGFTALWRSFLFYKKTNDTILCSSSEAKKDGFLRAFLKEALGSFVQHVKHDLAFCNLAI